MYTYSRDPLCRPSCRTERATLPSPSAPSKVQENHHSLPLLLQVSVSESNEGEEGEGGEDAEGGVRG